LHLQQFVFHLSVDLLSAASKIGKAAPVASKVTTCSSIVVLILNVCRLSKEAFRLTAELHIRSEHKMMDIMQGFKKCFHVWVELLMMGKAISCRVVQNMQHSCDFVTVLTKARPARMQEKCSGCLHFGYQLMIVHLLRWKPIFKINACALCSTQMLSVEN